MYGSLRPPWTAALQASLSITTSRSLLRFMSIESMMPSNHLILCPTFSCYHQSCPDYIYIWVSSLVVHLKLTQHCKVHFNLKSNIFKELTGVEDPAPRWRLTGLVLWWVPRFPSSGSLLGHLEGAPLQWWADLRMGVGGRGEARLHLSWSCLHTQFSRRVTKSCSLLEWEESGPTFCRGMVRYLKFPSCNRRCLLKMAVLPLLWMEVVAPLRGSIEFPLPSILGGPLTCL